jgi:hypothetical protein
LSFHLVALNDNIVGSGVGIDGEINGQFLNTLLVAVSFGEWLLDAFGKRFGDIYNRDCPGSGSFDGYFAAAEVHAPSSTDYISTEACDGLLCAEVAHAAAQYCKQRYTCFCYD